MKTPLLIVLEGANDIEFLQRLTRKLCRHFPICRTYFNGSLPDESC